MIFLVLGVGMSSVPTDAESVLVPKIPVTVQVYEGKTGSEPVPGTPKVGTELVLKIFRFVNSVPVPSTIFWMIFHL